MWNHYDFAGKLLHSQTRHQNLEAVGAKTRLVKTRTTYDHAGRVTASYQQVEEGTEERLAELRYNELGELESKKLGRRYPSPFDDSQQGQPDYLQQVDYGYTIRGWLTSINQADLASPAGQPRDVFGLELAYNAGGLYNGNISKQSWMSSSDQVARSYVYAYDPINRLASATYSAGGGLAGATLGQFSLSGMQYDKNGNIHSLTRQGLQSIEPTTRQKTFGVVDQLTYGYELNGTGRSNQLLSVSDGQLDKNYLAGDFKDGDNQALEYAYDGAGNLQKDLNKGISEVLYNHLNLPVRVKFAQDRYLYYLYDASGTKRRKTVKDSTGKAEVKTDYLGSMVYEKSVLEFVSTAEGRALPPERTGEAFFAYEYHYKDHLGNLRAAFRKAPTVPAFVATMEVASALLEEAQFDNIARTRSSAHALNGPVSGTKHSARVGPLPDGTRQVLGPWRTIAVKQGDWVQAQVFAYYESLSEPSGSRAYLTAFLDNPANVPAPGEQTNNLWDKLKIGLSFPFANSAGPLDNTLPVAYLKYLVYDKAYKPLKEDSVAITTRAAAINGGWEALSIDFTATEEGFVQVLVANESEKAVWFDDLQIKHTPALIVQENHYDPWGLNLAGIEKQGSPDHKFQYLGREKQSEFGLNWLDFNLRQYDPQLGRFHAVDSKPDEADQESLSPYQYGLNDPINESDPNGDCPTCFTAAAGAVIGGIIGGGIEVGMQLYNHGEVNDWKAVGGSALQGAITGGVAGLTGGTSLLATTSASAGANVVGGFANRTVVQGKETTANDVIVDAAVGAGANLVGAAVSRVVKAGLDNLSSSSKGKIGEAVTQVKYAARGYISQGKAVVNTGGRTATGRTQRALYDHNMRNVVTGKRLTVESKFNGAGLTRNQRRAIPNITTPGGLIIDRTTSQQLGTVVNSATQSTIVVGAEQIKKK